MTKTTQNLVNRFHEVGYANQTNSDAESLAPEDGLIGFFQNFRPNGEGVDGLFAETPWGGELLRRLKRLFDFAGDDRRPQGGRDVYFIVRNPKPLEPDDAQTLAQQWLGNLHDLASLAQVHRLTEKLAPCPSIRILEGIAPKHPKDESEKAELLNLLQKFGPNLVSRITSPDEPTRTLQAAYFYTACDWMLRDYLMWPLFRDAIDVDDPFEPYFQLWAHGVKYRIFNDSQVEIYLPRHFNQP
ncbi:hypothetical protein CA13_43710 [Planctomycetes bacterium CA13]|uniref:Uncharacterized protein n=1 Tax=Novipirellula herctigrandis TaxID=2527986 RepID=A0A5C5Z6N8_9BACT|nr:hypothetical protein CA13_43710 [Planctomycetes bacterium CA13]